MTEEDREEGHEEDREGEGEDADEGGNAEGMDAGGSGMPSHGGAPLRQRRVQTQRVFKGTSTGEWRDAQPRLVFKPQWQAQYPTIVPVPGEGSADDQCRCTVCNKQMQARVMTIKLHCDSAKHKTAVAAAPRTDAAAELAALNKQRFVDMLQPGLEEEDRTRTQQLTHIYHLMSLGRPISDFRRSKEEFTLLRVPHCGPKTTHWSTTAGEELARGLDAVVLAKSRELVEKARFVSISMDEASGIDNVGRLSVHVYVMQDWVRQPIFLEFAKLEQAQDAEYLASKLLDVLLLRAGLGENELAAKLVGASADGASVMSGAHSGVLIRLAALALSVMPMHCMAHRTDLAVGALEKAPLMLRILALIRAIYSYFNRSNKRLAALKVAATEANTPGNRPKRAIEVRWISMLGPMERVLSELGALLHLFRTEAQGDAAAAGIYSQLTDAEVLLGMHALLPALQWTQVFIKLCQSREVFVGDLAVELEKLRTTLHKLYVDPASSYQPGDFPGFSSLLEIGGSNGWEQGLEEGEEVAGLPVAGYLHTFSATLRGRAGRPRRKDLTGDLLGELVTDIKAAVTAAVTVLIESLTERFPTTEALEAFAIVYPQYWLSTPPPDLADYKRRLATIEELYCSPRTSPSGTVLPPLLSAQKLTGQSGFFFTNMALTSKAVAEEDRLNSIRNRLDGEEEVEEQEGAEGSSSGGSSGDEGGPSSSDSEDESGPAWATAAARTHHRRGPARKQRKRPDVSATTRVWRRLTSPIIVGQLSEFAALAELVLSMVPGSVEDERRFSVMSFLKNKHRNSLDKNLSMCTRLFSQLFFKMGTFPFPSALQHWKAAAGPRGRYK